MTDLAVRSAYGELTEPMTLTIQRVLPGTVERVWAYLTESDLRRQWLAAGAMELKLGATFEFVWRNSELTDPPEQRPEGFPEEHRLTAEITELDPPRRLGITWGSTGGVTFELTPRRDGVLLTIVHKRATDRSTLLNVSAGWHRHLDILEIRMNGEKPVSFWKEWVRLKAEYEARFPA
jgi:uncharacterized protein YndB with AHSA1/START domain